MEERERVLAQSQQVSPRRTYLHSNERPRDGLSCRSLTLPVTPARGHSSPETPDLEAFKISWDQSERKGASQETWSVVMNEQSFILDNTFVPVPWKKTRRLNFQNSRKKQNHVIKSGAKFD